MKRKYEYLTETLKILQDEDTNTVNRDELVMRLCIYSRRHLQCINVCTYYCTRYCVY